MFEVHNFDAAAVFATFAFSTLKTSTFGSQLGPDGLLKVQPPSEKSQHHIFIGLNYYFKPRDVFPGAAVNWVDTVGLFGGVSATALDNFFLALSVEPRLGVNLAAGVHWGTKTEPQPPYLVGGTVPAGAVPTVEGRSTGLFVSAGLDVDIFRKIFGTVTGLGKPPAPAATTPD